VSELEQEHQRAQAVAVPTQISRTVKLLQNELRIRNAEKILRGLLNTVSWHATRPFREINKLSWGGGAISTQWGAGRNLESDSPLRLQEAYLRYLKSQRVSLLKSRSWRFTRFFRKGLWPATRPTEYRPKQSAMSTTALEERKPDTAQTPKPEQSKRVTAQKVDNKLWYMMPPVERESLTRRIPRSGTFNINQLYEYDLV